MFKVCGHHWDASQTGGPHSGADLNINTIHRAQIFLGVLLEPMDTLPQNNPQRQIYEEQITTQKARLYKDGCASVAAKWMLLIFSTMY